MIRLSSRSFEKVHAPPGPEAPVITGPYFALYP